MQPLDNYPRQQKRRNNHGQKTLHKDWREVLKVLTGKIHADTKFRYDKDIQDGHRDFLPKIHFPPDSFLSRHIPQHSKKMENRPRSHLHKRSAAILL
jgi:hypothetical protein